MVGKERIQRTVQGKDGRFDLWRSASVAASHLYLDIGTFEACYCGDRV